MCCLGCKWYQHLYNKLLKSYLNGRTNYPNDLVSAYNFPLERHENAQQQIGTQLVNGCTVFVIDSKEDKQYHANVTGGTLLHCDGTPIKCFIYGANHFK